MSILNITANMTQQQMLLAAHSSVAIPAAVIVYISCVLLFLFLGLVMIDTSKSSYGKFLLIWFISSILSAIILTFVILSPNSVNSFWDEITSWF